MAAVPLLQQSENGDGPMPRNNPDGTVSTEDLEIVLGPGILASQALDASSVQRWAAKLLVNCYRAVGLAMLALILLGLVSYVALVVFYALDTTWISPQIISRSDDRVLHLKTELTQAALQYENLATQRVLLLVKAREAERDRQTASYFQSAFLRSIRQELTEEQGNLRQIKELLTSFAANNPGPASEERNYLSMAKAEAEKLYRAHLIDEEDYLSRKHQIGQADSSALSAQKNSVELDAARKILERQMQSHERLLKSSLAPGETLSYRVLQEEQEYDRAHRETAKLQDTKNAIQLQLAALDREMGTQNALLASIRESPYLRAADGALTVASLPYGNGNHMQPGVPIYGCSIGIIWCHRVGEVARILPGEVIGKHPFYNKEMRGVLVQMKIHEPEWAHRQVLFLKRAPLFF